MWFARRRRLSGVVVGSVRLYSTVGGHGDIYVLTPSLVNEDSRAGQDLVFPVPFLRLL